jgi:hypothetical protein
MGVGAVLIGPATGTSLCAPARDPRLCGCHPGPRRMAPDPTAARTPPGVEVWTEPALCKPWPDLGAPEEPHPPATLSAAAGETASLFVVLRASRASRLHGITVEPPTFHAPRGTLRPAHAGALLDARAVQVYQVGLVEVRAASNAEGVVGTWPDPLIPEVDVYAGERRRAFPMALEPGRTRAVYVEVRVPRDHPAGWGHLALHLALDNEVRTVPVSLRVRGFNLPATSSLPNTFGFSGRTALAGHFGAEQVAAHEGQLQALTYRYHRAALRHRLSLHGGSNDPAPWRVENGRVVVDFAPYDRELAPFLDGTVPGEGGARFTLIDLRFPSRMTDPAQRTSYIRQVVEHFRRRGWLSRLFDYTWDEPTPADLPRVRERARLMRAASSEVPRLVTMPYNRELDGSVDIWSPLVNHVDDKPGFSREMPARFYRDRRRLGERLFWYQSCMSHGCDPAHDRTQPPYFTGWPRYVIDAPAIAARIFAWLAFRYRIDGELYYNTIEAYHPDRNAGSGPLDPWQSSYLFGGNGDGTLFYPGRPAVIGGHTDVPVESLRLKHIRDGLQDYEYLVLAKRLGEGRLVERVVSRLAGSTHDWRADPEGLAAAREKLAAAIERRLAR